MLCWTGRVILIRTVIPTKEGSPVVNYELQLKYELIDVVLGRSWNLNKDCHLDV